MITLHPSIARVHSGHFRAVIQLRGAKGHMHGGKTSREVFETRDAARTYARFAAHVAARTLARDYPNFVYRVA